MTEIKVETKVVPTAPQSEVKGVSSPISSFKEKVLVLLRNDSMLCGYAAELEKRSVEDLLTFAKQIPKLDSIEHAKQHLCDFVSPAWIDMLIYPETQTKLWELYQELQQILYPPITKGDMTAMQVFNSLGFFTIRQEEEKHDEEKK